MSTGPSKQNPLFTKVGIIHEESEPDSDQERIEERKSYPDGDQPNLVAVTEW